MKIAVCIKQVPTREWHPRVDDTGTWIREADASYELNEPDAYALEEALRLRERHGGEVVVCSAGPPVHVDAEWLGRADAFVVADALQEALKGEAFDLILTGLQSDDQGHAQMGVVLAERLGVPHSTIIMQVEVLDGRLRVKRELEAGWFQWMTMPLPALITIQSGINQLRYATLKGIMAAKKKEIRQVSPSTVPRPRLEIVALASPSRSKQTAMLSGSPGEIAAELVRRLSDEARAL